MRREVRRLRFGAVEVLIDAPADADGVVRAAAAGGDAEGGYWAHVWPTAEAMADFLARSALVGPEVRVLEIGCGTGLAGIVAAKRGAAVILTDASDDAVECAARNAALNGVAARCERFDWRDEPSGDWRPDLLIGADVLYAPRAHGAIARLIGRLSCTAVLGHPNRPASAGAADAMRAAGLRAWETAMEGGRVMLVQGGG